MLLPLKSVAFVGRCSKLVNALMPTTVYRGVMRLEYDPSGVAARLVTLVWQRIRSVSTFEASYFKSLMFQRRQCLDAHYSRICRCVLEVKVFGSHEIVGFKVHSVPSVFPLHYKNVWCPGFLLVIACQQKGSMEGGWSKGLLACGGHGACWLLACGYAK